MPAKKKVKMSKGAKKTKAKPSARPKAATGKKPSPKAAQTKAAKTPPKKKIGAQKSAPAKIQPKKAALSTDKVEMTSKTAKGMPKKDLNYFAAKLLKEKQRVLEEMGEMQNNNLKQTITEQAGEISRYSYHLGDTASLSYDREFSMGLAERHQKYLEQIDDALERIEEGTYGICKVTGENIPRERLEEVPVAKYSVKGKELLERQKRYASP